MTLRVKPPEVTLTSRGRNPRVWLFTLQGWPFTLIGPKQVFIREGFLIAATHASVVVFTALVITGQFPRYPHSDPVTEAISSDLRTARTMRESLTSDHNTSSAGYGPGLFFLELCRNSRESFHSFGKDSFCPKKRSTKKHIFKFSMMPIW